MHTTIAQMIVEIKYLSPIIPLFSQRELRESLIIVFDTVRRSMTVARVSASIGDINVRFRIICILYVISLALIATLRLTLYERNKPDKKFGILDLCSIAKQDESESAMEKRKGE